MKLSHWYKSLYKEIASKIRIENTQKSRLPPLDTSPDPSLFYFNILSNRSVLQVEVGSHPPSPGGRFGTWHVHPVSRNVFQLETYRDAS